MYKVCVNINVAINFGIACLKSDFLFAPSCSLAIHVDCHASWVQYGKNSNFRRPFDNNQNPH